VARNNKTRSRVRGVEGESGGGFNRVHRQLAINGYVEEDLLEAVQIILVYGFLRIGGRPFIGNRTQSKESLQKAVCGQFQVAGCRYRAFDRAFDWLHKRGVISSPLGRGRGWSIVSKASDDAEQIRNACIDLKRSMTQ
jgi:hypothetical protein